MGLFLLFPLNLSSTGQAKETAEKGDSLEKRRMEYFQGWGKAWVRWTRNKRINLSQRKIQEELYSQRDGKPENQK